MRADRPKASEVAVTQQALQYTDLVRFQVARRAGLVLLVVLGLALAAAQSEPQSPAAATPLEPAVPAQPVPAVPARPALAPAQPAPLELLLETSEPELRSGRIVQARVTRRFALPPLSVAVSRERGRPSSGLLDALSAAAKALRRPATDARWVLEDKWVLRQQSAWTVDEALTRAYLTEALRYGKETAKLAVRRTPPQRGVQWFFDAGFKYHFGGGDSSAAGSPDFRVQNILAAAKQLDGSRLEAGAVFDFNRRVKIRSALGFVDGYVIRGSLLAKDIGGGICQVSTTVWRAAYQAGLPILERHQHSYSVSYYDPPGFEATVYAPSKNLRFRNDTARALWVQVDWDASSKRLALNFFGAQPTRRVTISEPRISNVRDAPRDRFVPDRSVKLGESKLVSGASDGLEASISRRVQYDSGRVLRDATRSRYVSWGAIYAVNPRDSRL